MTESSSTAEAATPLAATAAPSQPVPHLSHLPPDIEQGVLDDNWLGVMVPGVFLGPCAVSFVLIATNAAAVSGARNVRGIRHPSQGPRDTLVVDERARPDGRLVADEMENLGDECDVEPRKPRLAVGEHRAESRRGTFRGEGVPTGTNHSIWWVAAG